MSLLQMVACENDDCPREWVSIKELTGVSLRVRGPGAATERQVVLSILCSAGVEGAGHPGARARTDSPRSGARALMPVCITCRRYLIGIYIRRVSKAVQPSDRSCLQPCRGSCTPRKSRGKARCALTLIRAI